MTENRASTVDENRIPGSMRLQENENRLEFEYKWYKFKYVIAMVLTPVFAFFVINSDYVPGSIANLLLPGWIVLFCSFLVMYYSLAKIVNSTRIFVSKERIDVRHGPLPLLPNHNLKKDDVRQLYVTKHSIGHRYYVLTTTYQVHVIMQDKRVITIVKGLSSPDQGRFIENKVESFLEIVDVHVEGEIQKD